MKNVRFAIGRLLAAGWYYLSYDSSFDLRFSRPSVDVELAADGHRGNEFQLSLLRTILQKFPYWGMGHLLIAERLFDQRHLTAAYGSATAAKLLRGDDDLRIQHLFAKIFLGSSRPAEALVLLENLHKVRPQSPSICEDLAASCIQLENFTRALDVLDKVPPRLLSQEAKVMRDYLRQKG